jgi:hypothetical protein
VFPLRQTFAGDRISPKCSIIEVRLGEWKQLFDAIAPLPFLDRYSNVADRDAWRGDWQDVSPRVERKTAEGKSGRLTQP